MRVYGLSYGCRVQNAEVISYGKRYRAFYFEFRDANKMKLKGGGLRFCDLEVRVEALGSS